ncbi:MAG: ABC transporter ATP-binding protein [Lachnospiraceae bacterium]|nr:ABC transporter ATP-binding protein [Lachnospiraceae bacterium]
MKPENAIEVKNITKSFKIYLDKGHTLKEKTLFSRRRKYEKREVLKGISFEVKKGEAIGLIGHNGCGKSTTLKLLTKIMYPDSGTIEMRGRVSSLLELGAGFHPDLSGRENIYINASIFGLTKMEIDERVEDIIAFSELEEFIDNPVRTYSSGMYMRLAFAVAINVDADILLIDEILAVGDTGFQTKCFNYLKRIKAKGTTIVIVSHSMGQIEQICDRSIWIHEGRIKAKGIPKEVDMQYLDYMGEQRQAIAEKEEKRKKQEKLKKAVAEKNQKENVSEKTVAPEEKKRWGNGKAQITSVKMVKNGEKESVSFQTGDDITIQLAYSVNETVEDAVFGIGIFRMDGLQCYGTNTRIDMLDKFNLNKDGVAEIKLADVQLLPGEYLLDVAIESDMGIPVDYFREAYRFEMFSAVSDVGVARVPHEWTV